MIQNTSHFIFGSTKLVDGVTFPKFDLIFMNATLFLSIVESLVASQCNNHAMNKTERKDIREESEH